MSLSEVRHLVFMKFSLYGCAHFIRESSKLVGSCDSNRERWGHTQDWPPLGRRELSGRSSGEAPPRHARSPWPPLFAV